MKNKILSFWFIIIFLISGCGEMPNDPIPGTYDNSVNVILSTGKNSQQIYFNSIIGLYDSFKMDHNTDTTGRAAFIRNAKVMVNNLVFKEVIGNYDEFPYYELENPGFIQPDCEYNLLIVTDKNTITGRTRVPKSFSITSHPKVSTIELTNEPMQIKITWEHSQNARGYEYQIIYPPVPEVWGDTTIYYQKRSTPVITTDTCFYFDIIDKYNQYTIKIGAFDENFENYYLNKHYSSGVNGTYGVFCSMVVDSIVINVINSQK